MPVQAVVRLRRQDTIGGRALIAALLVVAGLTLAAVPATAGTHLNLVSARDNILGSITTSGGVYGGAERIYLATQTATGSGALYVGVVVCVTCTGRPSVRLPIMSTSEGKGARARLAVRESAELR